MAGLTDSMPEFLDLKTGRLASKKVKKEKTPEEECMANVKNAQKESWLSRTLLSKKQDLWYFDGMHFKHVNSIPCIPGGRL